MRMKREDAVLASIKEMKGVWKSNFKYLMNRDKWEDNCVKYGYGRM